jgi:hypothetical protein
MPKLNKVEIICPIRGSFLQQPNNHLQGKGCSNCQKNGFQKALPATLYYLKVTSGDTVLYKIGITNRTVKQRYTTTNHNLINIVFIKEFKSGLDCYNEEQRLLKKYKDYLYKGSPILSSGNTELFTKDIMCLEYIT